MLAHHHVEDDWRVTVPVLSTDCRKQNIYIFKLLANLFSFSIKITSISRTFLYSTLLHKLSKVYKKKKKMHLYLFFSTPNRIFQLFILP